MSNLVMQCPTCTTPFQVTPEMAGQVVVCPACNSPVAIPNVSKPEPADPSPTESTVHQCPICQGAFGVTPEMQGQRIACPHCNQEVTIEIQTAKDAPDSSKAKQTIKPEHDSGEEMFAPGFKPPTEAQQSRDDSGTFKKNPKPARFKGDPTPTVGTETSPTLAGLPPTSVTSNTSDLLSTAAPEAAAPVRKTGLPTLHQKQSKHDSDLENATDANNGESPDNAEATSVTFNQLASALGSLPAPFLVEDPARLAAVNSRRNTKVLLPDPDEGTRQLDQRLVKIQYKGETVELISRTPEEQARYRRIVNMITILIGLLFIIAAFVILLW